MVSHLEQIHSIESTIIFSPISEIFPDRLLIHPPRENKIPPTPEILLGKVLCLPKVYPRNLDGASPVRNPAICSTEYVEGSEFGT